MNSSYKVDKESNKVRNEHDTHFSFKYYKLNFLEILLSQTQNKRQRLNFKYFPTASLAVSEYMIKKQRLKEHEVFIALNKQTYLKVQYPWKMYYFDISLAKKEGNNFPSFLKPSTP